MEEEKKQKESVGPPRRAGFLPFVLVLVIVVLFVVFTAIYYQKTKEGATKEGAGKAGEQSQGSFSAVFLTNGQVYFGYLVGLDTAYPKLNNIYYLQFMSSAQPQQTGISREQIDEAAGEGVKEEEPLPKTPPPPVPSPAPTPPPASQQQSQLTLVKLGSELHGPIDSMTINKDHILFIEEMKEDSKVVQAIREYERQKAEEGE